MTLIGRGGRQLLVLPLALLPACSQNDDAAPQPTSTTTAAAAARPTALPCGREAETGPAGSDGIVPLGAFVSDSDDLKSIWLWESRIAYISEERFAVVCDLESGTTTVLSRAKAGHFLDTIRADENSVVWAEYDRDPNDRSGNPAEQTGANWTVYVHDLRDHRTTPIANGGPKGLYFPEPIPEIAWPFVVWLDLPPAGGSDEQGQDLVSFDLRDGTRRVLSSGTHPYWPQVTEGLVYFSAQTEKGNDIHVVAADGSSPPRRLTHEGDAHELDARNGWVAWPRYPLDHDPSTLQPDVPIAVLRVGSTTARVATTGQRWVVVGDGFVVASTTDREFGTLIVGTDGRWLRAFEGDNVSSYEMSIDGDRVAWVTVDYPEGKRKLVYLHLGRVQR